MNPPRVPEEGLTPLGRVDQLMNFARIHDEPPMVMTMDHRAVLVAAWAAHREGRFGVARDGEPAAPLLVRFDAHPDMGEKPRAWAWERARLQHPEEVHALVNAQRHDDGGWIIAAMQYGFASDILTFFVHDYHRFPGDNGAYHDHRGREHRLATWSALHEFLGADAAPARHWREAVAEPDATLWIDFDLDFATVRIDEAGNVRPWNDEEWRAAFPPAAVEWLAGLLERAALITVATDRKSVV